MKMNTLYKAITAVALGASLVGCSSTGSNSDKSDIINNATYERAPIAEEVVWSTQESRPGWTVEQTVTDGEFYFFVGESSRFATEKGAKQNARLNASAKASQYFSNEAEVRAMEERSSAGSSTGYGDEKVKTLNVETMHSRALVNKINPDKWYLEMWRDKKGKSFWKAYVLSSIVAKDANEVYDFLRPQEVNNVQELNQGQFDTFKKGLGSEPQANASERIILQ